MDEVTEYAHTHVVNFEPAYLRLQDAVAGTKSAAALRGLVLANFEAMGLNRSDLRGVNWQAMVDWERENA